MRILANMTKREKGDSYSVSMETMGDVPKEQTGATVDELFRMAREAIKRQIEPSRNGSKANGNGLTIKDPNAPVSKKQKNLIIKLAREKGTFIEGINNFTMQEASDVIRELVTA